MSTPLRIASRLIAESEPAFIVAELSCNHRQNIDIACETVRAARRAGADAIKVQTFTADTITLPMDSSEFTISGGTLWDGRTLHDLYQEASLPWEWHPMLQKVAKDEGLLFFSSPFDLSAVEFLDSLNVPCFKIASFELVDIALIEAAARKQKPMIMSTGIASLEEITEAVRACLNVGNEQIILLKCTSSYPTPLSDANLKNIMALRDKFNLHVGLSDHTTGATAPVVARALGACIIEKHLILERTLGGPDAAFSLTEAEFKEMVSAVRQAELALGAQEYTLTKNAEASRRFARSLYVCADIAAGEEFTPANVRSVRPGFGLPPKELKNVLGRRASSPIKAGTPLSWLLIK